MHRQDNTICFVPILCFLESCASLRYRVISSAIAERVCPALCSLVERGGNNQIASDALSYSKIHDMSLYQAVTDICQARASCLCFWSVVLAKVGGVFAPRYAKVGCVARAFNGGTRLCSLTGAVRVVVLTRY